MANKEHVDLLRSGVLEWRNYFKRNPDIRPNLHSADLKDTNLSGALLSHAELVNADLSGADLSRAWLVNANLRGANLTGAKLIDANLYGTLLSGSANNETNLSYANLSNATLSTADLSNANMYNANMAGADLSGAIMVGTNLANATIEGCRIYGISAWDIKLEGAKQGNMIVTPKGQPEITVDDLELAQFIYLLLNNKNLRNIIDTITSKAVLILGRFTDERKAVLDAIRNELRNQNFTPILFDFDKPSSKDVTSTVETLARLARFIIADLTDPSSIPHELATIVPFLRSTPIQPIILEGSVGYSMFEDFRSYNWVLETYKYKDSESLIVKLSELIGPANVMAETFRKHS